MAARAALAGQGSSGAHLGGWAVHSGSLIVLSHSSLEVKKVMHMLLTSQAPRVFGKCVVINKKNSHRVCCHVCT